jgi:hypothetical protein
MRFLRNTHRGSAQTEPRFRTCDFQEAGLCDHLSHIFKNG